MRRLRAKGSQKRALTVNDWQKTCWSECLASFPGTAAGCHIRFLSSNHSRPIPATIDTAATAHGVDDAGSVLGVIEERGVVEEGFVSGAFFAV
jgi:hypothetical protein